MTKNNKTAEHNDPKGTFGNLHSDFFDEAGNSRFPELEYKVLLFLLYLRIQLWQDIEKAFRRAGYRSVKKVYEVIKKPEVIAAMNHLKAIDLLRAQGKDLDTQTLAEIASIAFSGRHRKEMFDKNGELIEDFSKWPEALQSAVKKYRFKRNSFTDKKGNKTETFEFEVVFESALAALKELRRHLMEIGAFLTDEKVAEKTSEIFKEREEKNLSLIETVRLFEEARIPLPESIKLEIQDFDWGIEKRIRKAEENAKEALNIAQETMIN